MTRALVAGLGGELHPHAPLEGMAANSDPHNRASALASLVSELLDCGGVLSQLIAGMVEFEASGRSAPDAVPIPEMAHALVADVAAVPLRRYSKRDVQVAASIVKDVTSAICSDIYTVDFDALADADSD